MDHVSVEQAMLADFTTNHGHGALQHLRKGISFLFLFLFFYNPYDLLV